MDEETSDADARLVMSREEMRSFGYRVIDLLVDHFDKLSERPVGAKLCAP